MKKKKRSLLKGCRLRRGELTISTLADTEQQDRAYWLRQPPNARLEAMEIMRRINYGEAAAGRMERVIEIV